MIIEYKIMCSKETRSLIFTAQVSPALKSTIWRRTTTNPVVIRVEGFERYGKKGIVKPEISSPLLS